MRSIVAYLTFCLCLFINSLGWALIRGQCTDCHLMHVTDRLAPLESAGFLLKKDCVGCHMDQGDETIVNGVPIVLNLKEPVYPTDNSEKGVLAGGNFYWLIFATDGNRHQYGHNCFWIGGKPDVDPKYKVAPGSEGSRRAECGPCHQTLTTFGCESCHQTNHHEDKFDLDNPTLDNPFRFLSPPVPDSPNPSVRAWSKKHQYLNARLYGMPDDDWEQTLSSHDHNEYAGNPMGKDEEDLISMNGFCRGCHQNVHKVSPGERSRFSPWLRHPSGVPLPADKKRDAYLYNTPDKSHVGPYDPLVPVARNEVDLLQTYEPSWEIVPGRDQVMCLSCHRAHGSPYGKLLRWDYSTCNAGYPDPECGCFVCHSAKW